MERLIVDDSVLWRFAPEKKENLNEHQASCPLIFGSAAVVNLP
jgi:hypothetical protein